MKERRRWSAKYGRRWGGRGRTIAGDHDEHQREPDGLRGRNPEADESLPLLLGGQVAHASCSDEACEVADGHDDDPHVLEARADPAGDEQGDNLDNIWRDAEQRSLESSELCGGRRD